jgi:uncharacterized protein (DUF2141 family)
VHAGDLPWRRLSVHCARPAAAGAVALTLPDIPPGTYAVQAFHDENDNFDIDRNLLGLPPEGIMGFSNDAPMRFGPPRFDDAAIEIDGADLSARFKMRCWAPSNAAQDAH